MRVPCAVVAAAFAVGACTSKEIAFRNRPTFNPPPDSTAGFLGYFTVSTKQTTCGNCHVDHQTRWAQTIHAGAWAKLVASGGQASFCNGCHSVSERGNFAAAPAGYNKVADSVYQDVQCENCHGPGVVHVTTPDNPATIPLANISADTSATPKFGCAGCHQGTHEPFIQEWKGSKHSQLITFAAGNTSCQACHEGKGALAAWGIYAKYAEQNSVCNGTTGAGCVPTTCAVCHDPHGSPNTAQLRFSDSLPDENLNLCMKCHSRRATASATNTRGPHAPQGPMLLGSAGWWPTGAVPDTSPSTHGNVAKNPKLCAGCHVHRFTVTDPTSGNFRYQVTGHLFLPIPCLDPTTGIPYTDTLKANTCPFPGDPGWAVAQRSYDACVGCHGDATTTANIFVSRRSTIKRLADQIWKDVNKNQVVDTFGVDSGYLPKVMKARPGDFAASAPLTAAKGALFNVQMVGEGLAANGDRSFGVHNPFLAESLLSVSIQALLAAYPGILPAPPAGLLGNARAAPAPSAPVAGAAGKQ